MRLSPQQNQPLRLLAVQRFVGIIAAIMMLAGQSLAVGAMQSSGGIWIEICSGSGVKMVQTEDTPPMNDCSHCDYCTVRFSAVASGPFPLSLFGPAPVFAHVQFVAVSADTKPAAEQYWAANRGPPLTSEVNMTPNTAQWAAMRNSAQWRASWL